MLSKLMDRDEAACIEDAAIGASTVREAEPFSFFFNSNNISIQFWVNSNMEWVFHLQSLNE